MEGIQILTAEETNDLRFGEKMSFLSLLICRGKIDVVTMREIDNRFCGKPGSLSNSFIKMSSIMKYLTEAPE